jgi:hypothetical protein
MQPAGRRTQSGGRKMAFLQDQLTDTRELLPNLQAAFMKAIYLAVFSVLICACNRSANFSTTGGMSNQLLLTSSYEPSPAEFKVVLRNQSHSTLKVAVEAHQYHGRIVVFSGNGNAVELLDSRFIPLLMTSIWEAPIQTLPPQGTIAWTLPASILCDIHSNPLDSQTLRGATVHAEMDEVAVVPSTGSWVSDNAKQISSAVTVPAGQETEAPKSNPKK